MSLPWYLRPIQPSRWPWLGHAFPGVVVLCGFVAMATLDPDPRMPGAQGPMLFASAGVCWLILGWRIARSGRSSEQRPMSVPGLALTAAALTVLAIPSVLWPHLPDTAPLPPLVSTTTRLSWYLAGLLEAVGIYLILSYTRRPSTVVRGL